MKHDEPRARGIASIGRHHPQIEPVARFDRNGCFGHEWHWLDGKGAPVGQDDRAKRRRGEENAFGNFLGQGAFRHNPIDIRADAKFRGESVRQRRFGRW